MVGPRTPRAATGPNPPWVRRADLDRGPPGPPTAKAMRGNLGGPAFGETPAVAAVAFVSPALRGPSCRPSRILLLRRSPSVDHPGTWNLPGGIVEPGESDWDAAFREAAEEAGYSETDPAWAGVPLGQIDRAFRGRQGLYPYTVFAYGLRGEPTPRLNAESDRWLWVSVGEALRTLDLHPGLRSLGRDLLRQGL